MSASTPVVSVVIPAFNAAPFLKEAVESVLAQSYTPVEILVVDDGSTDATPEIARSFGEVVRLISQQNQGVAAARNHGLRESSGTYVCFVDADDWLYPEDLERKVALMEADPELALVHALVEVTGPDLKPTGEVLRGEDGYVLDRLLELIPPAIPGVTATLIRRSVLDEIGGFDESLGTSADYDLWLRIAEGRRVGRVDYPTVKYRKHEASMFANVEAQLTDMGRIFRKHRGRHGARPGWRILKWRFFRSVAGEYAHRGKWLRAIRYTLQGLVARIWP